MGRLSRWRPVLAVVLLAATLALLPARPVSAFSGFGTATADATYGIEMTFTIGLPGGPPDRLELLLDFAGDDSVFVAPVAAQGEAATYRWDADRDHVTPNTHITYRWRATVGDTQTLSAAGELLYDDDRAGLDWQTATIGQATVHWYGDAEGQARKFGELTADGAARAEATLGHELAGPIDIFVYDTQDEFFGALGPGAREWTGAATYPELRTIFMWLRGGPADYLETTIVHEVTHVVFRDATANAFHDPARWLNEGFASWSEQQNADVERSLVAFEAGDGLFAFPAITQQFPIGDRGARLAYAQGAVMVDRLIADHGPEAMASLAAAYREGATDDEALQAAAGMPAEQLYAAFFDTFGVAAPQPVSPRPIPPSDVTVPGSSGGAPRASGAPLPAPVGDNGTDGGALIPGAIGLVVLGGVVTAAWIGRRNRRASRP
ncbi:MAG: peptidase MA family metallohydrolase [Chloroflexota bacterium]